MNMRTKPKTAIYKIKEIKCRPKKTIIVSGRAVKKRGGAAMVKGRAVKKRGGAAMIKDRKMEGRSAVREALISEKVKEER